MTRRRAAGLALLVPVLFLLVGCGGDAPDTPPRPNIILIVADDLGYGDLGAYGQERIRTPNLDRMAREGMRFTQFYAGSTVCAPSRSVLMTGQHTGRTPIRGNEEVHPIGQQPLPDTSVTIAEVLQTAGYTTGAFGKWGLGAPGSEGVPSRQGFDRFFGYIGQRRAHFYWPEFLFESTGDSLRRVPLDGNRVRNTSTPDFPHPGAGPPIERGTYSHDAILERALSFIGEQARTDAPFFAYLPVTIPHASVVAPDSAFAPYLDAEGNSIFDETPFPGDHYTAQPRPKAAYAAMVTHLDRGVGRILDRLEAQGVAENTLVLFTSDNGPHGEGGYQPDDFNSNGPLRGMKRDLYEGGIRVPQIAWWPGRVEAGTTTDLPSYVGDYMQTFADLAGADAPAATQSVSLVPTLRGDTTRQAPHDYLYWEFRGAQAVRQGRWKAVRDSIGGGPVELYDLEADPAESTNVADRHPDIAERLTRLMNEAHRPPEGP
ncbi:MAG: arylsulfatase [Salinibacter sp.]